MPLIFSFFHYLQYIGFCLSYTLPFLCACHLSFNVPHPKEIHKLLPKHLPSTAAIWAASQDFQAPNLFGPTHLMDTKKETTKS